MEQRVKNTPKIPNTLLFHILALVNSHIPEGCFFFFSTINGGKPLCKGTL